MSQKYWPRRHFLPSGRVGAGIDMIPIGPPVRLHRLLVTSTMKPNAIVTIAR